MESFKTKTEINPKDVALSKRKERKEKILALEQANKNSKKRKGKARRTRKSKGKISHVRVELLALYTSFKQILNLRIAQALRHAQWSYG